MAAQAREDMQMNLPELPGSEVAWLDGVAFISVNDHGVWGAVREARRKLRKLGTGNPARVIFLRAVDGEGQPVSLLDPSAAALMVGYRLETPVPVALGDYAG